ncbi:hypothetical protein PpBr36_03203 [Pyricularia pennisetigena]|uniref:hypothetical protein n=1 Tax=Pyricularia pennisetigena TaxID=1578925 RepID=UPI00114FFC21|nr:hypothetical protein PpBr36_03203 [Pyricularia pennisetigena]TLS31270.1 hypothetical protein PpBr36_03203 [Pyricularia pennisetigena]
MASTIPRQPFAPLDGTRLQGLTSLKNRQNAFSPASNGKRKADSIDTDDSENVDPALFAKRSKGSDSFFSNDCLKPSTFILTKTSSGSSLSPRTATTPSLNKTSRPIARPRSTIQSRSPIAKINSSLSSSTPLSAPAGRSPTRGSKRVGILSNRRRTASPFTRVDPPAFGKGSGRGAAAAAAPFSLDAALKGTISNYASRHNVPAAPVVDLYDSLDSSWTFEIHEDTPEQEMTNLLQHSTCVLDISSDEESEQKAVRERAEGRDKENIPPADDVSQIRTRRSEDDMLVEKTRGPLTEMNAADYYADGCGSDSFIIVPGEYVDDEDAETVHGDEEPRGHDDMDSKGKAKFVFAPELDADVSVDALMSRRDVPAPQAALLQPVEGTGESFELWESGSSRDDAEPETLASPSSTSLAVEEKAEEKPEGTTEPAVEVLQTPEILAS